MLGCRDCDYSLLCLLLRYCLEGAASPLALLLTGFDDAAFVLGLLQAGNMMLLHCPLRCCQTVCDSTQVCPSAAARLTVNGNAALVLALLSQAGNMTLHYCKVALLPDCL